MSSADHGPSGPRGFVVLKCQATGVPLPFWASEMSTEARKERKLIKTLEKSIPQKYESKARYISITVDDLDC